MLAVLVALTATAFSVRLTLRNWPTDSEGHRLPRNYLPRERRAVLVEYPALCLTVGLVVSAPTLFSGGEVTFIVACLAAVCLGGLLLIQLDAMHRISPHR